MGKAGDLTGGLDDYIYDDAGDADDGESEYESFVRKSCSASVNRAFVVQVSTSAVRFLGWS